MISTFLWCFLSVDRKMIGLINRNSQCWFPPRETSGVSERDMTLLLLYLSLLVQLVTSQDSPPSPCPDVFSYVFDGGQWTARLEVQVPDQAKRMVVVASLFVVDVPLPPEHPGELQLLQDEKSVREQVQSLKTKKVGYNLELPVQDPLPLVDKIKVNGRVICQGPPVKARIRSKVSFTHRLNGLLSPPHRAYKLPDLHLPGDNLDMVNKEKLPPKNGLELTDDEIIKVELQEEEFAANQENTDQHFTTELNIIGEDNDELSSESAFHPDGDAEMLDNKISVEESFTIHKGKHVGGKDPNDFRKTEFHPDAELLDNEIAGSIPIYKGKDDKFNRGTIGSTGQKYFPKTEFEPVDVPKSGSHPDVELLDSDDIRTDIAKEGFIQDHTSQRPELNIALIGKNGQKDLTGNEFDVDEVSEIQDNEILQEAHLFQNWPTGNPKNHASKFKSGFVEKNDPKNHPKNEFDLNEDSDILDNDILQEADIHKLQNFANPKKHVSNFKKEIGKKGKHDFSKSKFNQDVDGEISDNEILKKEDIPKVQNMYNFNKNAPSFNREFHIPSNKVEVVEIVYENDGDTFELLDDDSVSQNSDFKYDRESSESILEDQSYTDRSLDVLEF